MAKSKSQRMKEYRARKKEQLGDAWIKKERERVKEYYTPTDLLTEKKKRKRRDNNRKNAKSFYYKKKKVHANTEGNKSADYDETNRVNGSNATQRCNEDEDNVVSSTSTSNENLMTVNMPFPMWHSKCGKNKGSKKRQSHALKRSYERIETLEDQNETLQRKLKPAQKRIQRFEEVKLKEAVTPKAKTDALLKRSGLKPKDVPEIREQLLYAECVTEEIKNTISKNPKEITSLQKVISGKVIKKYRLRSYLENRTLLERRKILRNYRDKRRILRSKAVKIKSDVETFLNRDDNSREMPGKGDTVKVGAQKKQKKILNDYLHNLHLKFIAETDYKISKASFCGLRPKEITLVNLTSRSVYLCSRHQNMSFKLRSLKNMEACSCTSPDSFVEMYKSVPVEFDTMLATITQEKIKFQQWKRVKLPNGKERMRIVDIELEREDFVSTIKKEFGEFVSHVERVTKQYKSVKSMKENLPKNHVLVQMDFSENYNCQTVEEIQSAYWNSSMVTLHPTIVYFNEDSGTLGHKSMVCVSEVLSHNASMVSAIISKTVDAIKKLVPDLKFIHFWTDSPSSQYRKNRFLTCCITLR